MGVRHRFKPTKTAYSTEMNTNFDDCENGRSLNNMTNDIKTSAKLYFQDSGNANDSYIEENSNRLGLNDNDQYLNPGADGDIICIEHLPRRAYSTNTYHETIFQHGWGYIAGAASSSISATVTFPFEFDTEQYTVELAYFGYKTGVPTDISDISGSTGGTVVLRPAVLTTATFQCTMTQRGGGNFTVGRYYVFTWIALGKRVIT